MNLNLNLIINFRVALRILNTYSIIYKELRTKFIKFFIAETYNILYIKKRTIWNEFYLNKSSLNNDSIGIQKYLLLTLKSISEYSDRN